MPGGPRVDPFAPALTAPEALCDVGHEDVVRELVGDDVRVMAAFLATSDHRPRKGP
jgi:hypothetical protein